MKNMLCLMLVGGWFFWNSVSAQRLYNADKITLTLFSEARLENIEAASSKGSASIINADTRELVFRTPIRSFSFEQKLMEEHFNENYMNSEKFPYAILKGKIVEDVDFTIEGLHQVTMNGIFTVHGITKQQTVTGTILSKGGRLFLDAVFMLAVSDYQIKIPNDKISNISQTIKITVHAEYLPKK